MALRKRGVRPHVALDERFKLRRLTTGSLTQQYSSTAPQGTVIAESPAAGTSIAGGSAINLVISEGPTPVLTQVPNVIGDTQSAVAAYGINNRGQTVGTVGSADGTNKINDRGQISGMAIVRSGPDKGNIHAFLATPVEERAGASVSDVAPTCPMSSLPANARKQILQVSHRFELGRSGR